MTLATDVESMYKNTKEVYDAIAMLGGTLPENKNLENLATAFDSLPVLNASHTVTFYSGVEGLPVHSETVLDGKTVAKPEDPVDPSGTCKFLGWKEMDSFNIVRFEPGKEGLEPFEIPVATGEKVNKPTDPTDPSGECKFEGWKEQEQYV